MKRISLTTSMLLSAILLMAAPVTQEEARQRAMQFVAGKQASGMTTKGMRLAKRQPVTTTVNIQNSGTANAYYVFNLDSDAGFVIVSGDDRTPAILGYADSGSFDSENIPDNMKSWLKVYEDEIARLDNVTTADANTPLFLSPGNKSPMVNSYSPRRVPSVRHSVAPLLTTTWNQNFPYNRLLLDTLVYKDICYTGCTATAMSQLLNYHARLTGKPETIQADISNYITSSNNYIVEGVSSGTVIDWENMQDDYSRWAEITTDEQRIQADAVGLLMHYCGAALKMDYTPDGSSASSWEVPTVLKKYFGYSIATATAMRSDYTLNQWNDLIYDELTNQRPVYYSGSSSGGGHAFIVDGFDGDELFHINWGWGGHCNGYYLLGLANPSDKTGIGAGNSYDGYAMRQAAIIGAQPDNGEAVEVEGLHLSFKNISAHDDQIIFDVYNENIKTATFDFGVAFIDDDGTLTPIATVRTASLPQYYGYGKLALSWEAPSDNLSAKIVLISREVDTEKWYTPMNAENYYIKAIAENGKWSFTLIEPKPELELLEMKIEGTPRVNRKHKVEAVLKNSGDEFYGDIMLITQLEGSVKSDTCTVGASIATGQMQTLPFGFTPKQEGKYKAVFVACGNSETILFTNFIDVASSNEASNDVNLNVDIVISNMNSTGQAILGNTAHMVTTITNDTDIDYYGLFVPLLVENGVPFSYQIVRQYFEAHTTTVMENDFDIEMGKRYIPLCMTEIPGRGQVTQIPVRAYPMAPAVSIYFADGTHQTDEIGTTIVTPDNAVAVDLRNTTSIVSVTPSKNANCLYYFPEGYETPAGLTGNVVKGVYAENLKIYDTELPFMPIADFTADTVCYTRVFDSGITTVAGKVKPSWNTICLPFEADRCLLEDGTNVEWMNKTSDNTYNFWLMEYLGDERGTLYFEPAEQMRAYTPYLIMVPGTGLKGLRDMTKQTVTFCGRNAALRAVTASVSASNNFKLVGTMNHVTDNSKAYIIDPDGTICRKGTVEEVPFRAYVKALSNVSTPNTVSISMTPAIIVEVQTKTGDVNCDGVTDVADIANVIDVMAASGSDPAADVNGDGVVDVADISAIIDIMAGK